MADAQGYVLSWEAEHDLFGIFQYTLKTWCSEQLARYQKALVSALNAIASGRMHGRSLSKNLPEVLFVKAEHHYVFYITEDQKKPLIIAIFHEKQDIVRRLTQRLPK
jgi:plasmid stabilization system protein ParE